MTHPNDENREQTSAASEAPETDVNAPETSLGPSNPFEVEEQTPDGGLTSTSLDDESLSEPRSQTEAEDAQNPSEGDDLAATIEDEPESSNSDQPEEESEPSPDFVWYVLKVQSSREDPIRDALERRIKIQGLDEHFGRIVVPTEKVTEIRGNKKRVVERKSYPGYIMIEMELNEKTWFVVRETPGVGDFVGAHGKPTPMTDEEVRKMLHQEEEAVKDEPPKVKIDVERGDRVKIKDGPFENFEGTVEEVIEQRGAVKVMLIIFNRPTPVDLEYWQVERI